MLSAPIHVRGNEWKDMITLADIMDQPKGYDNKAFENTRPRSNTVCQLNCERSESDNLEAEIMDRANFEEEGVYTIHSIS